MFSRTISPMACSTRRYRLLCGLLIQTVDESFFNETLNNCIVEKTGDR